MLKKFHPSRRLCLPRRLFQPANSCARSISRRLVTARRLKTPWRHRPGAGKAHRLSWATSDANITPDTFQAAESVVCDSGVHTGSGVLYTDNDMQTEEELNSYAEQYVAPEDIFDISAHALRIAGCYEPQVDDFNGLLDLSSLAEAEKEYAGWFNTGNNIIDQVTDSSIEMIDSDGQELPSFAALPSTYSKDLIDEPDYDSGGAAGSAFIRTCDSPILIDDCDNQASNEDSQTSDGSREATAHPIFTVAENTVPATSKCDNSAYAGSIIDLTDQCDNFAEVIDLTSECDDSAENRSIIDLTGECDDAVKVGYVTHLMSECGDSADTGSVIDLVSEYDDPIDTGSVIDLTHECDNLTDVGSVVDLTRECDNSTDTESVTDIGSDCGSPISTVSRRPNDPHHGLPSDGQSIPMDALQARHCIDVHNGVEYLLSIQMQWLHPKVFGKDAAKLEPAYQMTIAQSCQAIPAITSSEDLRVAECNSTLWGRVDGVVDQRRTEGGVEYLVRWKLVWTSKKEIDEAWAANRVADNTNQLRRSQRLNDSAEDRMRKNQKIVEVVTLCSIS